MAITLCIILIFSLRFLIYYHTLNDCYFFVIFFLRIFQNLCHNSYSIILQTFSPLKPKILWGDGYLKHFSPLTSGFYVFRSDDNISFPPLYSLQQHCIWIPLKISYLIVLLMKVQLMTVLGDTDQRRINHSSCNTSYFVVVDIVFWASWLTQCTKTF